MTTLFVFLVVLFSGNMAWAKLGESIQNRIDHSNSNSNNNKKLSSENERRNLQLSLEIIGEGGNPPPELLPLGECQGDCDTNADCGQGLICYQRRSFEAVPGCDGGADDETVRYVNIGKTNKKGMNACMSFCLASSLSKLFENIQQQ